MKVKITEIADSDAYGNEDDRKELIGVICSYDNIKMWDNGWYHGDVTFVTDMAGTALGDYAGIAFYAFKFEEIEMNKEIKKDMKQQLAEAKQMQQDAKKAQKDAEKAQQEALKRITEIA